MQKELREIQRLMQQQMRGRRWRPTRDLRAKILAWVTVAQQQGQLWPDICVAVRVDKARIKAWQQAAHVQTSASTGPLAMVPVQLAPQPTAHITAVVVRGLTVDDVVALVAAL